MASFCNGIIGVVVTLIKEAFRTAEYGTLWMLHFLEGAWCHICVDSSNNNYLQK